MKEGGSTNSRIKNQGSRCAISRWRTAFIWDGIAWETDERHRNCRTPMDSDQTRGILGAGEIRAF
jgi:hypothetical protein